MTTAVDTSVLLDCFGDDPIHGAASTAALRVCSMQGSLVVCDVVWAELVPAFGSPEALHAAANSMGLTFTPLTVETATRAGRSWAEYRSRGGTRDRVIADFLIAAHAVCQCDRLLTRDFGFFRRHFSDLDVVTPAP